MPTGIILYGPPGSGKDTVTAELCRRRPEYVLFQRLKAGPGRSTGYRITTTEHIERLAKAGQLLYSNTRYGAQYAIDRGGISDQFTAGRIPVLHLGQEKGINAIEVYPAEWMKVLLWCPRHVTKERCIARGDKDIEARLKAWDETRKDLLSNPNTAWSLIIPTHESPPSVTAKAIDEAVSSGGSGTVHLSSAVIS